MINIFVGNREGAVREVQAGEGLTLMEVLRDNGFDDLLALCGGCCSCATCHVIVESDHLKGLPAMSSDEDELLESSDQRQDKSRLSCQILLTSELDGLAVRIAAED